MWTEPTTIPCGQCDKLALQETDGGVLLSYPAQRRIWYRCMCGWKSEMRYDRQLLPEELFERDWRAANGLD